MSGWRAIPGSGSLVCATAITGAGETPTRTEIDAFMRLAQCTPTTTTCLDDLSLTTVYAYGRVWSCPDTVVQAARTIPLQQAMASPMSLVQAASQQQQQQVMSRPPQEAVSRVPVEEEVEGEGFLDFLGGLIGSSVEEGVQDVARGVTTRDVTTRDVATPSKAYGGQVIGKGEVGTSLLPLVETASLGPSIPSSAWWWVVGGLAVFVVGLGVWAFWPEREE